MKRKERGNELENKKRRFLFGPSNINISRERKRGTRTKKLTARRTDYDWQWLREGRDPAHPAPPSLPFPSFPIDTTTTTTTVLHAGRQAGRQAGGRAGHSHGCSCGDGAVKTSLLLFYP